MRKELIKTENYLLVVSDEEIKEGDLALIPSYVGIVIVGNIDDMPYTKTHRNWVGLNCDTCYEAEEVSRFKKIIAHLPLNNSPILQDVDLLPPLEQEDDVEKLAEEQYQNPCMVDMGTDITPAFRDGFQDGFLKAKEKYKYTEDDILNAIHYVTSNFAVNSWENRDYRDDTNKTYREIADEFIQSLSQPKMPIAFECEPIYYVLGFHTTTNSQGQTVWVGEYIY